MSSCEITSLVDAHFAKTIDPNGERALREHLAEGCRVCDARYRRQLLLAKLGGPSSEERIAHGLGFSVPLVVIGAGSGSGSGAGSGDGAATRRRRTTHHPLLFAAASLAVAAVVFLLVRPRPRDDDGFASRGAVLPTVPDAASRISVFRVEEAGRPLLLSTAGGAAIRRNDELAFDYSNAAGKTHLMIFAVDETRRVYWFYPAWTNEKDNPTAIAIDTTDREKRHELREAIRHPFEGHRLTLHGLFIDRPITVREVETLVRDSESGEIMVTGANDDVMMLEVSQ